MPVKVVKRDGKFRIVEPGGMIAAIERRIAKHRKRRYRVCLEDLESGRMSVRCARCGEEVPVDAAWSHLHKWFDALGTSSFSRFMWGRVRTRAFAFKDIKHQCKDLA